MAYSADLKNKELVHNVIDLALAEDTGHGDITSQALIPPELQGRASVLAKDRGILAGTEVARDVFQGRFLTQVRSAYP